MSYELETVGLASIGGLSPGGKADLSGEPCRNCGEMVNQRHCPRCGQLAASFHRPFIALVWDSISDSFALDSRLSRTLPLLFFMPGLVNRRYVEGRRCRRRICHDALGILRDLQRQRRPGGAAGIGREHIRFLCDLRAPSGARNL